MGSGIVVHGVEHSGWNTMPHFIHELSEIAHHAAWLTFATCAAAVGIVGGDVIVAAVRMVAKRKH